MNSLFNSIGLAMCLVVLATCAPSSEVKEAANEALALAEQNGTEVAALERRIEDLEARLDDLESSVGDLERDRRMARIGINREPCWQIGNC
jgi:hypothetical protein